MKWLNYEKYFWFWNLKKPKKIYKNNTRIKHTNKLEKNLGKNVKYNVKYMNWSQWKFIISISEWIKR